MSAEPVLDQVWQEYRAALKAFLHTKVSNPDDVDDLLQEVLLKSFINLKNLKDASSIKAWLFQIANHSVIDFYRKNATKTETQVKEEDGDEVLENTIKADLSPCVLPFIRALPEAQAELLKAIELTGISQKSYAEQQGVPYSTLKSQVKKARSDLKVLFDQCCHFQQDKFGNLIEFEKRKTVATDRDCDTC